MITLWCFLVFNGKGKLNGNLFTLGKKTAMFMVPTRNGVILSPPWLSSGSQVVIASNVIHAHWWKTYCKGKTESTCMSMLSELMAKVLPGCLRCVHSRLTTRLTSGCKSAFVHIWQNPRVRAVAVASQELPWALTLQGGPEGVSRCQETFWWIWPNGSVTLKLMGGDGPAVC